MKKSDVQLLAKIPDTVLECMQRHDRELFMLWQSMVELFPSMYKRRRQRFYLYVAFYLVKEKLNDLVLADPGGNRLYPMLCSPMCKASTDEIMKNEKKKQTQPKNNDLSASSDEERIGWGSQFD